VPDASSLLLASPLKHKWELFRMFNTVSGEVSVIIALMAVFGELQPYAIMASPGEDW